MLHNTQKDFLRRHIGPSEEEQKKIAIFLVLRFQKSIKIRYENTFQNNIAKKGSRIDIWDPFWLPKTFQIDPESDVERSLFRDAMELARMSPQINWAQHL